MDINRLAALVLWMTAVLLNVRGVQLIVRGAGAAGHPDQSRMVIKGFRRMILAGGFICFGLGFWLGNNALHILGAVFLLEEAVETQLMTWAVKRQKRRDGNGPT